MDEVQRGCTSLCEVGFFDLQYGYQLLEMIVMSTQILVADSVDENAQSASSKAAQQKA